MLQTNRMSSKDPISLEGFEELLDRAFEPQIARRQNKEFGQRTDKSAPNLVASNLVPFVTDNKSVAPLPATGPASERDWSAEPGELVAFEQLKGEILLLRARLDYAFRELAKAKFKEKRLRTKLASMEDQLKLIPELFNKAVRLRELENYLTRLTDRLSKNHPTEQQR